MKLTGFPSVRTVSVIAFVALVAPAAGSSEYQRLTMAIQAEGDRGRQIELTLNSIKAWTPEDGRSNLRVSYTNLGALLLADERPADAVAAFDHALKLDPSDSLALSQRGSAHYQWRRGAEALRDHSAALPRRPDDAGIPGALCADYDLLDRAREGLPHCERAASLFPRDVTTLQNLASVRAWLGDARGARDAFERAVGGENQQHVFETSRWKYAPQARLVEASVLWAEGADDRAEAIVTEVLRDHPRLGHAALLRGRWRLRRGRTEAAISDFDLAYKIDPRLIDAWAWRAAAHEKAGRPVMASEDRAKACRLGWTAACSRSKPRR